MSGASIAQSVEEPRNVTAHIDEVFTYDDNLFRLPSTHTPYTELLDPGSSTADYIESATAGVKGLWSVGRQIVDVQVDVSDNRFIHNSYLDNVSGFGKLKLEWQFGNRLSGELDGDYERILADFANTLFFSKDLIATTDYYGKALWQIGPSWSLDGLLSHGVTSHTNEVRDGDDYEARSGELGIHYAMSASDSLALAYQYTHADFRQGITFNGLPFNRNYDDSKVSLNLKYGIGSATWLEATAGYLDREYPDVAAGAQPAGNFSGDVWNASIRWQPTVQSGIKLGGWRDLRANLDAESNYFVSRGFSIGPVWSPIERLTATFEFTHETQEYIGSGVALTTLAPRSDKLATQRLFVVYKASRILEFDVLYKFERRASDETIFQYRDKLLSATFKFKF